VSKKRFFSEVTMMTAPRCNVADDDRSSTFIFVSILRACTSLLETAVDGSSGL